VGGVSPVNGIGVAPVKPAEFVIIQIQQMAAQAAA